MLGGFLISKLGSRNAAGMRWEDLRRLCSPRGGGELLPPFRLPSPPAEPKTPGLGKALVVKEKRSGKTEIHPISLDLQPCLAEGQN